MKVILCFVFFCILAAKLELQQRRQQQSKPPNSRGSRFTDIPQDPKSFLADEERDDKPLEKTKSERKQQNGEKREKKQQQSVSHQQSPAQGGRQIVGRHKKSPKSPHDMSPGLPTDPNTQQQQDNDVFSSDFNNLTISVSNDYKSVRLSQTPLIGSGRVGPRQITKTQFQGIEPEIEQQRHNDMHRQSSQNHVKAERRPYNKDQKRNNNSNNNNFRQQPQKSSPKNNQSGMASNPPSQQQQQLQQPNVKQFSVQDRLKRAQACNTGNNNNSNNKNLILNIIAANEILAEERN